MEQVKDKVIKQKDYEEKVWFYSVYDMFEWSLVVVVASLLRKEQVGLYTIVIELISLYTIKMIMKNDTEWMQEEL